MTVGSKLDQVEGRPVNLASYDVVMSTRTGEGLDTLLDLVGEHARQAVGKRGEVLPSRLRHVELLREATGYLREALAADSQFLEIKAENLRLASDRIGRISGAVDVEDLLDVIFSQFCIGK